MSKIYLGGVWEDGFHSEEIRAPWDGQTIGAAGFADADQMQRAIRKGHAARTSMAALPAYERRRLLHALSAQLEKRADDMANLICAEAGKPITFARGEVARGRQTLAFAAEEAGRLADQSVDLDAAPTGGGRFGIVRRFPVGLVAAISPFNFPLNLALHKIAPALATGCPVILKPSEKTPLTALLLAEVLDEIGLPEGAVSVMPAWPDVADALVTDERVKLLSFTGSPKVGWMLKSRAGKKRVALELGGNASAIVHHDTDVKAAAKKVALGCFAYAGQVCISVQRILVHQDIESEFRRALIEESQKIRIGNPTEESVVCGPVIDGDSQERIAAWLEEAKAAGASVVVAQETSGSVVGPTLLENVPDASKVWQEEIFGPVACIKSYADVDEAIALTNASRFGLQAGVYTNDLQLLWKCYEKIEVGGVMHNDNPMFRVDQMPYGGVKDSGLGREGMPYALEDYTERRLLALKPGGV